MNRRQAILSAIAGLFTFGLCKSSSGKNMPPDKDKIRKLILDAHDRIREATVVVDGEIKLNLPLRHKGHDWYRFCIQTTRKDGVAFVDGSGFFAATEDSAVEEITEYCRNHPEISRVVLPYWVGDDSDWDRVKGIALRLEGVSVWVLPVEHYSKHHKKHEPILTFKVDTYCCSGTGEIMEESNIVTGFCNVCTKEGKTIELVGL